MPNSNLYQEKNTLRCKFFDKNDGIYHRNAQTPYHRAGDKAFVRERFHDGPKQKAGEKPVVIDAAANIVTQNNFLTRVFDSYRDYLKVQQSKKEEYEALLDVILENVELITDADTANEVTGNVLKLSHFWDTKVRAGMMINERCYGLGLKFNKLSKQYEYAAATATA